jgi:outer membrane biosynthesis protein TonB
VRGASKPGNPFVTPAVLASLLGAALVGAALYYHFEQRKKHFAAVKLLRGVELLDRLTPVACDYFYAKKEGALPLEAWAPLRECEKDPDFFEAMITRSKGAEDHFVDAARYKGLKSRDGTVVHPRMYSSGFDYLGERGPQPYPEKTQVQRVLGEVAIGDKIRPAIFFRRPILLDPNRTDSEMGKAVIILFNDVPSPEPGRLAAAPAPESKPETQPAPAPEEPKPAPAEQKPPAPAPTPAPEEKPAAEAGKASP